MLRINENKASCHPPTAMAVANEHIRTPLGLQQMLIWPLLRSFEWANVLRGPLSETAHTAHKSLKHTNYLVYSIRHPRVLQQFFGSLIKLQKSFYSGSLQDIATRSSKTFIKGAFSLELFAQGARVLHQERFLALTPFQLSALGVFGFMESGALCLSGLYGIKKQITVIRTSQVGSPEFKLGWIRLVSKVSLTALGILGMIAFSLQMTVSATVLVGLASILLISRLGGHFYEKLYVESKRISVAN